MRPIAAILLATSVLCSPALAADKMSSKELTALLSGGRELTLGGPGMGYAGTLSVKADGTASGVVKEDSGETSKLSGTWKIKKDAFCRKWKEANKGQEICETWVKKDDHTVTVMNGKKELGQNSW